MEKLNCWEFMKCGRQPGGDRTTVHGICPAATYSPADRLNYGVNAGRICWVIAGRHNGNSPLCSIAKGLSSCSECEFYRHVVAEEGLLSICRSTGYLLTQNMQITAEYTADLC